MASLYQKYRPQDFTEVLGQEHVVTTLKNAIERGEISHAYLFCGPRGTGKTTIARILGRALKTHELDFVEIDAASNRGIDEVRALKEKIQVVPARSQYKVFIIDEVHMLTKEAFNALLKTLEEPPQHAIFILATTEPERLLPTIISRTQRFDFSTIPLRKLADYLQEIAQREGKTLERGASEILARRGEGSVRDALSLLDQLMHFVSAENISALDVEKVLGLPRTEMLQLLVQGVLQKDAERDIQLLKNAEKTGIDFTTLIDLLIEYHRALLLEGVVAGLGSDLFLLIDEQKSLFQQQASQLKTAEIISHLRYLFQAKEQMRVTPIPALPLEMAFLGMIGESKNNHGVITPSQKDRASAPVVNETPVTPSMIIDEKDEKSKGVTRDEKKENNDIDTTQEQEKITTQETNESVSTLTNVEPVSLAGPMTDVLTRWGEALLMIKKKSFAIGGFLRGAVPVSLDGENLTLSCKFSFHRDKIIERKTKVAIETFLEEIFGVKLHVVCLLEEELPENLREQLKSRMEKQQTDLENNALEMFEGKVVE